MADVTISGLSLGSPNKDSAIIPYSDGSTTYKTSPAGIVAASPGSVIQVVGNTNDTAIQIDIPSANSTVYTGLNISITPKFITSKLLVQASITGASYYLNSGANQSNMYMVLYRRFSDGAEENVTGRVGGVCSPSNSENMLAVFSFNFLDNNVNSVSQVTYKFYASLGFGSGRAYFNRNYSQPSGYTSMFTIMEIAG